VKRTLLISWIGALAVANAAPAQRIDRSKRPVIAPALAFKLPPDTRISTNDPVALYFATAHLPSAFPSSRFPRARGGVFAWHSSGPDPTVESPEELRQAGADLAPIGKAGDWTLYRVTP